MTTVEKDHGFELFCKGKSNRAIYTECCSTLGIRRNSALAERLSDTIDCFDMRKLDLSNNYLGDGIKALMNVLQANRNLEELNCSQQGFSGEVLSELLEVVRAHPRLTSLNLSQNDQVNNHSAAQILDIAKRNTLLYEINVSGGRMAKSYQRKIQEYTSRNHELEKSFFKGDYLRMKKLFSTVDTDCSGYITPKELLNNIDVQQVVITLSSFMEMDGEGGVTDHVISVNEFLNHVYPHYKSIQSIAAYSRKEDVAEIYINKNYSLITSILRKKRIYTEHLHMLRVYDCELTTDQLERFVEEALTVESTTRSDAGEIVDGKLYVSYPSLKAGLRKVWSPTPPPVGEELKHYKMSPTLVRHIMHYFDKNGTKSRTGSNPRVKATKLFDVSFETALIKLHLKLVIPFVQKHAIDINTMELTLQETIVLIEEFYDILVFDKRSDKSNDPL